MFLLLFFKFKFTHLEAHQLNMNFNDMHSIKECRSKEMEEVWTKQKAETTQRWFSKLSSYLMEQKSWSKIIEIWNKTQYNKIILLEFFDPKIVCWSSFRKSRLLRAMSFSRCRGQGWVRFWGKGNQQQCSLIATTPKLAKDS